MFLFDVVSVFRDSDICVKSVLKPLCQLLKLSAQKIKKKKEENKKMLLRF